MNLFIIILHYGDIAITRKCVDSLQKNDQFPKQVLIVNNTDHNIEKEFNRKIIILNNKKNLGFARGVNKGIAYALKQKATHVLLLNNDTVITRSFVKTLLDEMEKRKAGIVGPAITFKKNDKTLFDVGGKINKFFWRTSHMEVEKIQNTASRSVDYVSGCCMLIKQDVLKRIGLFDEQFFLYYEDADLCMRAKSADFSTFIVPLVIINHKLSASKGSVSSFTIYHLMRSGILFGRKYARSLFSRFANRLFLLAQACLFLKANPLSLFSVTKALLA